MSRASAAFAEPREHEEATTPEREAAPSPLPSGVELLIGELHDSLINGLDAFNALAKARASGDRQAIASAAHALAVALGSDPKALARKIAVAVKP